MRDPKTAEPGSTPDDVLDELLVLRGQAGDRGAVERLVRRWQPRLLQYARHLTGHAESARDVVQESWISIIRGLGKIEDPRRFGPFAMRIVMRRAVDASRQAPPPSSTLLHDPEADSEGPESESVGALHVALRSLPPDRRALLALRYQQGLDDHTIAKLVGVPAGTVKSRLHGARERLREILQRTMPRAPDSDRGEAANQQFEGRASSRHAKKRGPGHGPGHKERSER